PIVWRNSFTDRQIIKAASELVQKVLEPEIRSVPGFSGDLRVAMLVEENSLGQAAAKLMQENFVFNGKKASENPSTSFASFSIGDLIDPVGNPAPEAKIAGAIQAVHAFKPHIIVHAYAPAAIA